MATTVKLGAQTETALEATLIECAPGSAVVAKADEQPPGERKNVDESGQVFVARSGHAGGNFRI